MAEHDPPPPPSPSPIFQAQTGQISATWDISSSGANSSSSYQHEGSSPYSATSASSSSGVAEAVRRDVAACNIRSWWDIAALEQEKARQPAPMATVAASASPSGSSSARARGGGCAAASSSMGTVGAARGSSAKVYRCLQRLPSFQRRGCVCIVLDGQLCWVTLVQLLLLRMPLVVRVKLCARRHLS